MGHKGMSQYENMSNYDDFHLPRNVTQSIAVRRSSGVCHHPARSYEAGLQKNCPFVLFVYSTVQPKGIQMSSLCLSFFMLKLGCLWATFLYYLSLQNGLNSPHLHLPLLRLLREPMTSQSCIIQISTSLSSGLPHLQLTSYTWSSRSSPLGQDTALLTSFSKTTFGQR